MDPDNGGVQTEPKGRFKRLLSRKQSGTPISHKKRRLILGVSLLVVIMLVGGILAWQWRHRPKLVVCGESIVREANPLLDREKATQLKPVVEKIKQLKDYNKDANCLFITATYAANTDNLGDLETDLTKLDKVYDPKVGLNFYFTKARTGTDSLRQYKQFLEKGQAEANHNSDTLMGGKP